MSNASYVSDSQRKISLRPSRQAIRRAALALARRARRRRRRDFGYDYFTTGPYLEINRRCLRQGRLDDRLAEGLRLHRPGAGRPTTRRLRPASCWLGSTTAISGPHSNQAHADVAGSEATVRNLNTQIALQQPIIEQGIADVAAAEGNPEIRAGRTGPLRRADEVRLRHHPARPADRRGPAREDRAVAAGPVRRDRRQRKVEVLSTERAKAVAQLDHARAVAQQAALNLSYTRDHGAGRTARLARARSGLANMCRLEPS